MIAEKELVSLASLALLVLPHHTYKKIKQKKIHTKLVRIKVCLK